LVEAAMTETGIAESGAEGEAIRGKRILVVEDEAIVAMLIEDILLELGAEVVGPATRLAAALALARGGGVDAAILDVNLAGEASFPVAAELRARGIPFAFATGYGAGGLPPDWAGIPVLAKPFREADLRGVLGRAIQAGC
jgi:CheY-like chemotaxis protein